MVLERLLRAMPEDMDLRRKFVECAMRLGDVLSRQDRYQEALGYYVKGLSEIADSAVPPEFLHLQSELKDRIENTRLQTVADGRL
jgi:hypothetical protein